MTQRISDEEIEYTLGLKPWQHNPIRKDVWLDLQDARARIQELEKQLAELHKQLRWMVRGWDRCHHNEITHEECVTIGNVRAYLAALTQAEEGALC